MTGHAGLRALLLTLALMGAGAAFLASRVSLEAPAAVHGPRTASAPWDRHGPAAGLDSVVIVKNAFRLDRRAAPIPYEPGRADGPPPPPVEPRPALIVAGVVLGRTRAALLRGLPGTEGVRVLAEGEEAGGVRVLRVADTAVVVTWRADTLYLPLPGGRS
jgi:hypothetical protein